MRSILKASEDIYVDEGSREAAAQQEEAIRQGVSETYAHDSPEVFDKIKQKAIKDGKKMITKLRKWYDINEVLQTIEKEKTVEQRFRTFNDLADTKEQYETILYNLDLLSKKKNVLSNVMTPMIETESGREELKYKGKTLAEIQTELQTITEPFVYTYHVAYLTNEVITNEKQNRLREDFPEIEIGPALVTYSSIDEKDGKRIKDILGEENISETDVEAEEIRNQDSMSILLLELFKQKYDDVPNYSVRALGKRPLDAYGKWSTTAKQLLIRRSRKKMQDVNNPKKRRSGALKERQVVGEAARQDERFGEIVAYDDLIQDMKEERAKIIRNETELAFLIERLKEYRDKTIEENLANYTNRRTESIKKLKESIKEYSTKIKNAKSNRKGLKGEEREQANKALEILERQKKMAKRSMDYQTKMQPKDIKRIKEDMEQRMDSLIDSTAILFDSIDYAKENISLRPSLFKPILEEVEGKPPRTEKTKEEMAKPTYGKRTTTKTDMENKQYYDALRSLAQMINGETDELKEWLIRYDRMFDNMEDAIENIETEGLKAIAPENMFIIMEPSISKEDKTRLKRLLKMVVKHTKIIGRRRR